MMTDINNNTYEGFQRNDIINEKESLLIVDNNQNNESTFFSNLLVISKYLVWHLRLIGIGHNKSMNMWIKRIHIIIIFCIFLIHDLPWFISALTYAFFIYISYQLEHLNYIQSYIQRSKIDFERRFKLKFQNGALVYLIVFLWGTCLSMIPVIFIYQLPSQSLSKNIDYLEASYDFFSLILSMIIRCTIFLLFYFICYFHYLEKEYFLQLLETRSLLNTPWYDEDGDHVGSIGKNQNNNNPPSIDSILLIYSKLRESLGKTYRTFRLLLVGLILALGYYWLVGVYGYFIIGSKLKVTGMIWMISCPLLMVLLLLPILFVNIEWVELPIQVRTWIEYTMEERVFLMTYFTQKPIEFSLFGFVVSKQIVSSVVISLLATSISLIFDHFDVSGDFNLFK